MEQARAKHDNALRLLQRSNFTRYLTALQAGDDNMALQYSKEIRSTVAERAKIVGAYAPQRAEVDVNVSTDASAIIDRMELPRIRSERPAFELHYPHMIERMRAEAHAGRGAHHPQHGDVTEPDDFRTQSLAKRQDPDVNTS